MKCFAAQDSWGESISPFHREASFSHLRRVCRCHARKLCPHFVNDVEIAVRTIVISQANIGTHRLRVRSIELNQACKRQEPSEGIIPLQARQHHGKVSICQRQSKSVPGLRSGDRKLRGWTIVSAHAEFIQCPSVIPTKSFKKVVSKPSLFPRPVGKLMPREMIETIRNEHVFVNVKGCCDSLRKHICDVIIGVGAVIEFRSIRSLPLLCLHCALSVRRMENKTLELHFPDSLDCRSD